MSDPGPRPDLSRGHIEVICGPMFSGKTEELIRRLRRAQIARQNVIVVKPRIDDRYDQSDVVSHSSQRIQSIPIDRSSDIEPLLQKHAKEKGKVAVVGIDEAQFFDDGLIEVVERLADRGIRVVVAGLDQDYMGKPFGPMPNILCAAEVVTKQLSVCMVCGSPASKSQRVHPDAARFGRTARSMEQVLVGAGDSYEARCRSCYVQGIDVPSRIPSGTVPA